MKQNNGIFPYQIVDTGKCQVFGRRLVLTYQLDCEKHLQVMYYTSHCGSEMSGSLTPKVQSTPENFELNAFYYESLSV